MPALSDPQARGERPDGIEQGRLDLPLGLGRGHPRRGPGGPEGRRTVARAQRGDPLDQAETRKPTLLDLRSRERERGRGHPAQEETALDLRHAGGAVGDALAQMLV